MIPVDPLTLRRTYFPVRPDMPQDRVRERAGRSLALRTRNMQNIHRVQVRLLHDRHKNFPSQESTP